MVLELSSQGYSEREIGSKLQISHITVHRDLMYLKTYAQENLQKHIHEVCTNGIPEMYDMYEEQPKRNLRDSSYINGPTGKATSKGYS